MLYSFGVFETLITRTTATPQGIFSLMQKELIYNDLYKDIPAYVRENFCDLRIGAEKMARYHYIRNDIEDILFDEIYEALYTVGELKSCHIEQLKKLEKKIELENFLPIEENIKRIKTKVKEKNHVVLISDTYLDKNFIKSLMMNIDKIFSDIPIYVSSEYRKCKHSTNLYKLVHEKESACYEEWRHMGNDEQADIISPRVLGITVEKYKNKIFWDVEKACLRAYQSDAEHQIIIGASQYIRNYYAHNNTAIQVGCSYAGPILYPYVQWILKLCNEKSINRLYFIARDGYVLKRITDIIINRLNIPIKTHYIYGSRKAWRMAAYDGGKENLRKMLAISDPNRINTLYNLADILQISLEELLPFIREFEYMKDDIDYGSLCQIVHRLVEKDEFRTYLVSKHTTIRQNVISYLKQEIDFSDSSFAFIELRGSGYTTKCLADLMRDIYEAPINIFYYNLVSLGMTGNSICYNYIIDYFPYGIILELLCRAKHGQTNGYKKQNGKMTPLLGIGEGKLLDKYGFDEYLLGIEKFVTVILDKKHFCNYENNMYRISRFYLDFFSNKPDNVVLDFLSDMPFYMSSNATEFHVFAPKLNKYDIRNVLLFDDHSSYSGISFDISLLRTDNAGKRLVNIYSRYKEKIVNRFQRMYHRQLVIKNKNSFLTNAFIKLNMVKKKCVIYGAGRKGQNLYRISTSSKCEIVAWLDKKHNNGSKDNCLLGTIDNLNSIVFDVIVVAINDRRISLNIKHQLLDLGINKDKIKIYNEDLWYQTFLKCNLKNRKVLLCGEGQFYNEAKIIVENSDFEIRGCLNIEYEYSLDTIFHNIKKLFSKASDKDTSVIIVTCELEKSIQIKKQLLTELEIPEDNFCILMEKTNKDNAYLNVW